MKRSIKIAIIFSHLILGDGQKQQKSSAANSVAALLPGGKRSIIIAHISRMMSNTIINICRLFVFINAPVPKDFVWILFD